MKNFLFLIFALIAFINSYPNSLIKDSLAARNELSHILALNGIRSSITITITKIS